MRTSWRVLAAFLFTALSSSAEADGDPIRGGLLYDKWWEVIGAEPPPGSHPLYPAAGGYQGPDSYRCKECHGWDYKGVDGAYGGGSHRTGIRGVYGTTKSEAELLALLGDPPELTPNGHGYAALGLDEDDLEDLVAFVTTHLIDTSLYIASKRFLGDPVAGAMHFADDGGCVVCHGADGRALNFGTDEDPEYVGTVAVDNPWELMHKIRVGQPGSFPEMPSWTGRGGSDQAVADIGRYIQDALPTGPPMPPIEGDPVRGGLLYDKWWEVNHAPVPPGSHPLYPPTGGYQGPDSYRCKECHGWDYKGVNGAYGGGSHRTGIPGVLGTTKSDQQLFDLLKNPSGTTPNGHGFGGLGMSDQDVRDLVRFLRTMLFDMAPYIGPNKRFIADPAAGATAYTVAGACVVCHGADGRALNFGTEDDPEYVGTVAIDNPWELMHKIRVGQPGSFPAMPSWTANGGSEQGVADIGRYIQDNLPSGPVTPPIEGDPVRGGLLYDKWWEVNHAPAPTGSHPLYPPTGGYQGPDSYRCKECHGWDYKGVSGAYGSGSHRTGIRGVLGTTKSDQQLFDLLKNPSATTPNGHGFGGLGLSDQDVRDLVRFVRTMLFDMAPYIGPNKRFIGNAAAGATAYAGVGACVVCHGADGRALNFGTEEDPEYVGTVAVDNPWELMHKIRVGQPGSFPTMPSWTANGGSEQGVADIGRYIQDTLPTGPPSPPVDGDPIRGGQLYDKWWEVNHAAVPAGSHPLYPPTGGYQGPDSYRCKECHGWDYKGVDGAYGGGSHRTGIRGVLGTTKSDQQMFDLIKHPAGTTPNGHGFGALGFSDQDVRDVVRFVRTTAIDTAPYIGPGKQFRGDPGLGAAAYAGLGGCVICHGPDGTALNFGDDAEPEYVGTVAVDNPWELMHKIRVGQPGSFPVMPSWTANGGSDQAVADIGRYIQDNFPVGPPEPPVEGDPIRGGLLYDKWWEVKAAAAPSGDHPLYPEAGQVTGADTYRCKECHGWDYKGVDGAYGSGSHRTGIRGVLGTTRSDQQLFDLIKNPAGTTPGGHGFGALGLEDQDVRDLVRFVRTMLIDTDAYIASDKTFKGDAAAGQAAYAGVGACTVCHGADGAALNFGDDEEPEWVGTVAADNPWELMHKIRIGQPGSVPAMPSWTRNGGDNQVVADIGRYIQLNLPAGPLTGDLAIERGVARRSRRGTWTLKGRATYRPGFTTDYVGSLGDLRVEIDGTVYFDGTAPGTRLKIVRDRRSGAVVRFTVTGSSGQRLSVNLKRARLVVALRNLPADRFEPKDGVTLHVRFGSSRATVTSPVTFRGASRGILTATGGR